MPSQELRQQQSLSQQQMQALAILSLDGAGLEALLQKEEVENPVLDMDRIPQNRAVFSPSTFLEDEPPTAQTDQDLRLLLESQLPPQATEEERHLFGQMTEFLEPGTGLIPESVQEIAGILSAPLYRVERCLAWMHQMEPAGVGAATTAESLVLQAYQKGCTDHLLYRILFDHLEDVAAKRYRRIARTCKATSEAVALCVEQIRSLEPYPTAAFGSAHSSGYILPDVVFTRHAGQWQAKVQDRWSSGIPYSSLYDALSPDAAPELRSYLQEQRRHASYLLHCVERRRKTLLTLANLILETQQDFLEAGAPLRPLTEEQLATAAELSPSTVSRALKGKYVQTPGKMYPLTFFLTRPAGPNSSGESRSGVLAALSRLLQAEDPARPLSDTQLAQALSGQGLEVSRRTVAKYRLMLGVPGTSERKQ